MNQYIRSIAFGFLTVCLPFMAQAKDNCCTSNEKGCTPCSTKSLDCIVTTCDFIVVGLGAAGCPIAKHLSDPIDGEYVNSVCVFEEGPNLSDDPIVLRTDGEAQTIVGLETKYSVSYATRQNNEEESGNSMNLANWAASYGRMWGGSTGHNNMATVRGTPRIYDAWAATSGNTQWTYDNLLPVFLSMETYTPNNTVADPAQRGDSGPIFVTQNDFTPFETNAFVAAWAAAGNTTVVTDYNVAANPTGISAAQRFVTPTMPEVRSFGSNAYLTADVVTPEGVGVGERKLQIVSEAKVSRILFDTSGTTPTATGVEYVLKNNPDKVLRVYARKKIILCAGAVSTPGILQRSGVGPTALLNDLGIPVVVDSPHVGQNLVTHYGARMICSTGTAGAGLAPGGVNQAFFDLSIPDNGFGYTSPFPNDDTRRFQCIFTGAPFLFGVWNAALWGQDINPGTLFGQSNSLIGVVLDPQSSGTVEIPDTNPLTIPQVRWNFYSDGGPGDGQTDAAAIVAMAKIFRIAIDTFGADLLFPTPAAMDSADDNEIFQQLLNVGAIFQHPAGTCRFGTSIANGVVDGNLHVFGVNNLMVADLSVESTIEDGNTAWPGFVTGLISARICGSQTVPALP